MSVRESARLTILSRSRQSDSIDRTILNRLAILRPVGQVGLAVTWAVRIYLPSLLLVLQGICHHQHVHGRLGAPIEREHAGHCISQQCLFRQLRDV